MANIEIIQGDCLEVMKTFADNQFDLVLTDPPYVGLSGGVTHLGNMGVAKNFQESKSIGDLWNANHDWLSEASRIARCGLMVFCSYKDVDLIPKKTPLKKVGLITWDKISSPVPVNNVPHFCTEFIWAFRKEPGLNWRKIKTIVRDVPNITAGCVSNGERLTDENGKSLHPCQKPLELIKRLLFVEPKNVLDPFIGTGTTACACESFGIDCVGIEISPEYCEIARKRVQEEKDKMALFNGMVS